MRGAFDDEILDRRKTSHDVEFTLGAGAMLLISAGLVIVCGLCLGLGYMIGHRGATSQVAIQQTGTSRPSREVASSQQKPSATAQPAVPASAQAAVNSDSASQAGPSDLAQTSTVAVPVSSSQSISAPEQPQVRPALPAQPTAVHPAPAYPSRPAFSPPQQRAQLPARATAVPPANPVWVQIAAVSHVEDAQVLTTALRKRGYNVTPRREPDNLIHVRIGPFSTRDEANRWRAKLLDDGYNAEIE
jgi:DedD protein